jgi:phosphoserine phosphatase
MEARPPADVFVGFGGNAVREKVKAGADWFVMDFAELISSL